MTAPEVCRSLFDEEWYRSSGPPYEGDAYEHFAMGGWAQRRSPHPLFDVAYYLEQAPELLTTLENPLAHYVRVGAAAGLSPHPLFDTRFYLRQYGHLIGEQNALIHYVSSGGYCGFDPNPFFATELYRNAWAELRDGEMNPLVHYAIHGGRDWRFTPHPQFDAQSYGRRRRLAFGVNPLVDVLSRLRAAQARPARAPGVVDLSAIVLNLNKSIMTATCVLELLDAAGDLALEVIVVDNGSEPSDFARLVEVLPQAVKIVRVPLNRYFGEGNNLGVEASSGRSIVFINNDAFIDRDALAQLHAVLTTHPDAGAVGPKFVYPDGRLQECGGFVTECGTITQRGKGLDDVPGRFDDVQAVDYVSAACLMMPRATFDAVGGFDLIWDPAYYEDVDLCLRVKLLGKRTYYCPGAVVTHVENATSGDTSHGLRLSNVVEINREKFVARWGDFIERGAAPKVTLPAPLEPAGQPAARTAVLYTPYPLIPGGGERYLLTIAALLAHEHVTYLVTRDLYSTYRLRTMANELGMDLSRIRLATASSLTRLAGCDVFVAIGNEPLPPLPAMGRRAIFVCQFPLPMHPNHEANAWGTLDGYDEVVVYSPFAARHFRQRAARYAHRLPPVTVLPPACPMYAGDELGRMPGRIVNVGRFAARGHCKRQDVLIDAFRRVRELTGRDDLELHLVGTVSPDADAREFYAALRRGARDVPVFFHLNAPADVVRSLYATSSYYWHATGFGRSEVTFPEAMEHFGISVVEAMSAGAIPLVYGAGGPAEIVRDRVTGFHWRTVEQLATTQATLLAAGAELRNTMRAAAADDARRYDLAAFATRFAALLGHDRIVPAGGTPPEPVPA